MYLLDTNVVSETRKPGPHAAVVAWLRTVRDDTHISAVTLGEIQAGIEITRSQDADKARDLEAWLDQLATRSSVLPMDGPTFRRWALIMQEKPGSMCEDPMIAATAQQRDLTVVTRNIRDFTTSAVRTLDSLTYRG